MKFNNPLAESQSSKMRRITAMANEYFTIIRCDDGIDYIYYNNVRITTAEDAKGDLLARLNELRNTYINERLK